MATCKCCKAEVPKTIRCHCPRTIRDFNFWRHVKKADGCWIWAGHRNKSGYGIQCHALAHRLAWVFTYGPITDNLCVLHHCDNPPCVNPDHLFLGTQADNLADMDRKGRRRWGIVRGEQRPNSVLTDEIVRQIRHMYGPPRGKGVRRKPTAGEIATTYGVSRVLVCEVVNGNIWRHVQ